MSNLKKTVAFFFYENCSRIKITSGSLEHGYLALLNDDLESAEQIFRRIDSPRAKWALILVSILRGVITEFPTYFQIRNFLEIDLDLLIKNYKIDYIEQVLGSLEHLVFINSEIYKYIARVMYENKFYAASLKYMNKAKKINYKDAELHFLLAKYYFGVNDYENSTHYLKECQKLVPDYYPTQLLLDKIEELNI